ncbi:hypothetical protein M9H77_30967 [Catharanthus roseus]|uniref:Uncharacterized protein n=1 Tax=Catharanthus roseus TaxID=4058 RepID=A0ACC0A0K9_CATRO|nr:hypothetical protein M9H77_30967 [Catharanthus roseus]
MRMKMMKRKIWLLWFKSSKKSARKLSTKREEISIKERRTKFLTLQGEVKGLIGAWDQDSSESEGEEKDNMYFMALESEVQSSPSNFSSFIIDDDDDDDPNSMLIEMYDELKKIFKRNKELKNKIDDLLNENSKLICENKTRESLEVLKNEKDFSNKEFQNLVLENKNLCEKFL